MKQTPHMAIFEGSWLHQVKNGVYKVGLTVGLNVALGVQVRLTDKLRGFGEIFANYLVLSPTNYDETITGTSKAAGGTPTPLLPLTMSHSLKKERIVCI